MEAGSSGVDEIEGALSKYTKSSVSCVAGIWFQICLIPKHVISGYLF